ncbi:hypothetical protein [Pseudarthrobacter sp. BIM B-2242]|uniref:hypothetical protein n=1 Tax=Pseudarthrobacter sp. BIM B-2242 TaxID=2772401 RepID=UPI00272ED58A|nr:hypothetical protein [Pseudarthrobacter sp. BIM B-2242]
MSPFSTNGALVLANAPEDVDKDKFYKQILAYSGIVAAVGPAIAWLAWWFRAGCSPPLQPEPHTAIRGFPL